VAARATSALENTQAWAALQQGETGGLGYFTGWLGRSRECQWSSSGARAYGLRRKAPPGGGLSQAQAAR
jgi:hypothetical protein